MLNESWIHPLFSKQRQQSSCPLAIRWSFCIIRIPPLPFLLFIFYSFSPDSLWCDSSTTTYSQKKNNFTCCQMLHNSQQGNFFSVRDRNQQWETAASWVILWHWEDFSIPPFPSRSLSLSALFMTLLKNDKSYVLVVYWQKCCEGIREQRDGGEGKWMTDCLFFTQPFLLSPQNTHIMKN